MVENDGTYVRVSLADVYNAVQEQGKHLAAIEASLKTIADFQVETRRSRDDHEGRLRVLEAADIEGHLRDSEALHTDQETRIRLVERRLYAVPSLAALIAVSSLVVSIWQMMGRLHG